MFIVYIKCGYGGFANFAEQKCVVLDCVMLFMSGHSENGSVGEISGVEILNKTNPVSSGSAYLPMISTTPDNGRVIPHSVSFDYDNLYNDDLSSYHIINDYKRCSDVSVFIGGTNSIKNEDISLENKHVSIVKPNIVVLNDESISSASRKRAITKQNGDSVSLTLQ